MDGIQRALSVFDLLRVPNLSQTRLMTRVSHDTRDGR
jgi:hypothetical protein